MYFFTSDEHYGHANIIEYCNRLFNSLDEMNNTIIARHNEKVGKNDIVVHVGDFCWAKNYEEAQKRYISKLNGNHIFVKGSHDRWLPKSAKFIWRKMIEGQFVVACHYAGRTWERAYHKSWQVYGHWHEERGDEGLQYNVCVDLNDFYPVSFDYLKEIMTKRLPSWELSRKRDER